MPFEVAFQNFSSWPQSVIIPNATPKNDGVMTAAQAAALAALVAGGGSAGRDLVVGDFSFGPGGGWGNTGAVTSVRGKQNAFEVTITTGGGGELADPDLDFHYPVPFDPASPPFYQVALSDSSDAGTLGTKITWDDSGAAVLHITFNGTPANGKTYTFTVTRGG